MEKNRIYNLVLILIILISLSLLIFENTNALTGHATMAMASSNVSVLKSLSISFSNNLSSGISFGNVALLPVANQNGTNNYDGISSGTSYYVNISEDGNIAVDICIKADGNLVSLAADNLGITNESYANSSSTNFSLPDLSNEVSFTTSYVKSGENIAVGEINYYRFWLDIPAAQPSGDYNNTISFKGIQTGDLC